MGEGEPLHTETSLGYDTDMLGSKYSISRSSTDMEASLGSWIPAENHFPDENLKVKRQPRGYSQAWLQSEPSCGCWVWLFCSARLQGGAQGIILTQPGPARRAGQGWPRAWPCVPTPTPKSHTVHRAALRRGVCLTSHSPPHAKTWVILGIVQVTGDRGPRSHSPQSSRTFPQTQRAGRSTEPAPPSPQRHRRAPEASTALASPRA